MGKRLKELLAQGKLVRVFGMGQLCHPKFVEMIGHHGGYDAEGYAAALPIAEG